MNWKEEKNEKVRNQLLRIVELFQSENIPKAIKELTFPAFDVPANKWSLSNRLIMFFSGTSDARGFNQWKNAERRIKKGSKAVYILAPNTLKCGFCKCGHRFSYQTTGQENVYCPKCKTPLEECTIKMVIAGFRGVPVFRKEDTEGKDLEYERIELPPLPLLDVAEKWGIEVKGIAFQGGIMGFYQSSNCIIALASPEEKTFFHELAHVSQDKLGMLRKERQNKFNEVTAEVSALVLSELVGREDPNAGATYNYIKGYIGTENKEEIGKYLIKVLSDVEKIVNNIIATAKTGTLIEVQKEEPVLVEV